MEGRLRRRSPSLIFHARSRGSCRMGNEESRIPKAVTERGLIGDRIALSDTAFFVRMLPLSYEATVVLS